ncbi:MAG: inositol monophosphatase family protein [Elusimicrobiota bacterium]|jgi:myo-inositol-1(or 4)-monophosphatase
MKGLLKGKTVLITRPEERASGFASMMREQGARTLCTPLIRIAAPKSWKPLDRALHRLDSFDCVVFTSLNSVEAFFRRARKLGIIVPNASARIYAIGPVTARALREKGLRPQPLPESYDGPSLARSLLLRHSRGKRILIPRAQKADEALPRLLRRAGSRVAIVPVYRTLPDPKGLRSLLRLLKKETPDWTAFFSASAVEAFTQGLVREKARALLLKSRAASIGPATSEALRKTGIEPSVQAEEHTARGLSQALLRAEDPSALKALLPALRSTLWTALREAGDIQLKRLGKVSFRYKGLANLVTAADLASEQRILDVILKRFPDHDFLTEERAPKTAGSDFVWIIDPIDGTTNYAHGFPAFCVSIGLSHRGRSLLSGVFDPSRGEIFWAERGKGAHLLKVGPGIAGSSPRTLRAARRGAQRLRVSRARSVREALLLTGFAYDRAKRADYLLRFYREFMIRSHDVRRSGSAALDLAWTAAGRVDGYWEFSLNPWDVAAGSLLVEEAGGKVTDLEGRPWPSLRTAGAQTLASNGLIHSEMLKILRPLL